jgi:hypothetical protein
LYAGNFIWTPGDLNSAVRQFGCAQAARETLGAPLAPVLADAYERTIQAVRTQLKEETFMAEWARRNAVMNHKTAPLDGLVRRDEFNLFFGKQASLFQRRFADRDRETVVQRAEARSQAAGREE